MTSYLLYALLLLGSYLALEFLLEKMRVRLGPTDRTWFGRCADVGLILSFSALIGGGWLLAIGESQLKPHVISTSINGHVLSTFTATNPAYLTWETREVLTTNGVEYRSFPKTNYYWSVWPMFK